MKIGFDVRTTQLGSGVRGIGNYVYTLLEGLISIAPQNEYVLFALPDLPLPDRLKNLPSCCRVVWLPTKMLRHSWRQRVRYLWRLGYVRLEAKHARELEKVARRERLDVLHQTTIGESLFFPSCRPDCYLVQTFYDAIPMAFPEKFLLAWPESERFVYRRQLMACRRADAVIAISESARQDAVQYAKVPDSKIKVVYPALSEQFQPVTDKNRMAECLERLDIQPPYFLFCSGLEPTKNLERIMQAFGQFSVQASQAHSLVMVTRQPPNIAQWAWDANVLKKQIVVTGYVSDEDLITLYAGATALLTPSLYEGFGLPSGQAMKVGTPVIASNRSSQPEVVGDAGLQVDPEDVDAIAQAMLRLASDSALRAELSIRGRERAALFNGPRQAAGVLDVYAQNRERARP